MLSVVEIDQWRVLEEKMKTKKRLLTDTDMQSAFSSGELKPIKSNPKKQIFLTCKRHVFFN